MTNIVLCGGSGTRLWPISRTLMPKQFVKLFHDRSLFQLTVMRNRPYCTKQFIISNMEHYFLTIDQLEEIGASENRFILEPIGRNTAPAIALACFALDPEEIVLVTPSDHLVKNESEYKKVVTRAKHLAQENYLVTFGIKPLYPEEGYGYIEANGEDVVAFHEKPSKEVAKRYLTKGGYYWNAGIFCFKAGVFLKELQKHAEDIYNYSQKAYRNAKKNSLIRISYEDMVAIPEESIDYAVMEKSSRVKVIPSDIDWSDLGSFDALSKEFPKDQDGNTQNENLITINSHNNFIYGQERIISLVDIDNLIIVDTPDALLVAKKGSTQKVKELVAKIKERKSGLHHTHTTVHRPWGTFTILEEGPKYKVKRIEVKPGKRLSLQKHFHRSEHWIVVSGTATVTVGEETRLIRPNESTYIKMGEVHRLENQGKIPVVLIEAQVGEYTGEDDILRLEDDYQRI